MTPCQKNYTGNFEYYQSFLSFAKIIKMELIDRIKITALHKYKKLGLRSVTLDDIAQELGISKKTIYQHFKDKEELVNTLMDDELAFNRTCCLKDKTDAENAVHEIFLAMKMLQQTFAEMSPSFLFELKKYHFTAYHRFEKFKQDFLFNIIKENLERGVKENVYRPEINTDVLSVMRLETMSMLFNDSFPIMGKYDLATIENELLIHFLYGVVNTKGKKLIDKYWKLN